MEEKKSGYYDQTPEFNKDPSKLKEQLSQGAALFFTVALCIVFYFALLRLEGIKKICSQIIVTLQPIIYGFAIAYLLNPMVKGIENFLKPKLAKKIKKEKTLNSLSRGLSITGALIIAITLIVILLNMIIPQLIISVRGLIFTLPDQMNSIVDKINEMSAAKSTTGMILKNAVNQGTEYVQNWIRTDLLSQTNKLMTTMTASVITIVGGIFDVVIGFIVSAYVLTSKEHFSKQCKKLLYALVEPRRANLALHITQKSNEMFGGFIIGKIIDSIIIGLLCFICLTIFRMPYTLLVSVIVGVTNVIPFFGPYIGAVPCTILIALENPMQGVYFVIFILVLQQIDGNIIGPKILGNSTGLSSFWVIFAILTAGGLFGFVGMILGVPTFAVIYYLISIFVEHKLEVKNLPSETDAYDERSYVRESGQYVPSSDNQAEPEETFMDEMREKMDEMRDEVDHKIDELKDEMKDENKHKGE